MSSSISSSSSSSSNKFYVVVRRNDNNDDSNTSNNNEKLLFTSPTIFSSKDDLNYILDRNNHQKEEEKLEKLDDDDDDVDSSEKNSDDIEVTTNCDNNIFDIKEFNNMSEAVKCMATMLYHSSVTKKKKRKLLEEEEEEKDNDDDDTSSSPKKKKKKKTTKTITPFAATTTTTAAATTASPRKKRTTTTTTTVCNKNNSVEKQNNNKKKQQKTTTAASNNNNADIEQQSHNNEKKAAAAAEKKKAAAAAEEKKKKMKKAAKKAAKEKFDKDFQVKLQVLKTKPKDTHGNVRLNNANSSLRSWCSMIRKEYIKLKENTTSGDNTTLLTQEMVVQLIQIGFDFKTWKPKTFDQRLLEYIEFKAKHNDNREPKAIPNPQTEQQRTESSLLSWCTGIRDKYSKNQLSQEQIDQLKKWNFKFDKDTKYHKAHRPCGNFTSKENDKIWNNKYQHLVLYQQKFGHTRVPRSYPILGEWVKRQRIQYRNYYDNNNNKDGSSTTNGSTISRLTAEKIQKLNDINFESTRLKAGGHYKKLTIHDMIIPQQSLSPPTTTTTATLAVQEGDGSNATVTSCHPHHEGGEEGMLLLPSPGVAAAAVAGGAYHGESHINGEDYNDNDEYYGKKASSVKV